MFADDGANAGSAEDLHIGKAAALIRKKEIFFSHRVVVFLPRTLGWKASQWRCRAFCGDLKHGNLLICKAKA